MSLLLLSHEKTKANPGSVLSLEHLPKLDSATSRSDLRWYKKRKKITFCFISFKFFFFFLRNCVQMSKCLENYMMLRSCQWLTCLRCGHVFLGKKVILYWPSGSLPLSIINTHLILVASWEFPFSCYTANDRSSTAEML